MEELSLIKLRINVFRQNIREGHLQQIKIDCSLWESCSTGDIGMGKPK